ncbi:hypothetical protein [Pseudomonas sp. MF6747]|uniref:hypothetical protein n=1 Tax=Pseudomonas sp. MF6747 TaxID=2797527 RepID=UPI00190C45FD|nr:hypothetical protein [Pseudomonas sp. MF6747]MBK3511291.1 hypothetical protein [Pseudomonas sp. MF6747]
MEFTPWIESLADNDALSVAAELLGEKRRTVASWVRFERVPSFKAAMNIYEKSGGRVDFNGIYMPFLKAVVEGHARFS